MMLPQGVALTAACPPGKGDQEGGGVGVSRLAAMQHALRFPNILHTLQDNNADVVQP